MTQVTFNCKKGTHTVDVSELCQRFALLISSPTNVKLRYTDQDQVFKTGSCSKTHYDYAEFTIDQKNLEVLLRELNHKITQDKDVDQGEDGNVVVGGNVTGSNIIIGNYNEVTKNITYGSHTLCVIITGSGIKVTPSN